MVGLLVEAAGGLSARFAEQLAEHVLSTAEFEILLRLARTPGAALRMNDLAAQTQLTTSGVTRVVDRLEHAGLVRRLACPTDRRGLLAHLTRAGRDRLDAAMPGHLAQIDRWLTSRLSTTQMAALADLLRVVRDGVAPGATAGARPGRRQPR